MNFRQYLMNGLLFAALLLIFIGCDNSTDSTDTEANVTGTMTLPAAAEGKSYSIIFDTDDDGLNGFVKIGFGTCGSSKTVDYSVSDVPEGNYYISAVVYVVTSPGSTPTTGDYGGFYGSDSIPPAPNAIVPAEGAVSFDFDLVPVP